MTLAALIAVAALAALAVGAANFLRARDLPPDVGRHLAGVLGGFAYLLGVLMLDAPTATGLAALAALALLGLRLGAPAATRGVRGGRGGRRWGEVVYAAAGSASLAVGWLWLGDRWLAFLPIAFMAWGDNAAGLARLAAGHGAARVMLPPAAMLATCLAVAALVAPGWVGLGGAVAATAAERLRPTDHPFWDDNWAIVAGSLLVMAPSGG